MTTQTLAQVLLTAMEALGKTRMTVAKEVEINDRTLRRYLNNETVPDEETVKRLARVLGLNPVRLEALVKRRLAGRPPKQGQ